MPELPAPTSSGMDGLIVPVRGVEPSQLRDTYDEKRGDDTRAHEALDIPSNT